jgi:flagellar biogenesis protein FliO
MAERTGGWAGWLMARLGRRNQHQPQLELLERIALGPRQSLALVDAAGRRVLVAFSADGGPVFYPLDDRVRAASGLRERTAKRLSW